MKLDGVSDKDLTVKGLLRQVLRALERIENQQGEELIVMTQELQNLQDQVTKNTSAEESAVQLLNGLSDQIKALKDDPAALQQLANSLKTSGDDLAAAIVANTPASTQPPVDQPPVGQPPTA